MMNRYLLVAGTVFAMSFGSTAAAQPPEILKYTYTGNTLTGSGSGDGKTITVEIVHEKFLADTLYNISAAWLISDGLTTVTDTTLADPTDDWTPLFVQITTGAGADPVPVSWFIDVFRDGLAGEATELKTTSGAGGDLSQYCSDGHLFTCPPEPQQPATNFTAGSWAVGPVVDPDPVLELSCSGFQAPLAAGAVTVKKNRVLPHKAVLLDEFGTPMDDTSIAAHPVIQVLFDSNSGADAEDVTDDALPNGAGTEGNVFEFLGSHWQFNLKTKNYSGKGTYTVTVMSGDEDEYTIAPTCEATFVID